MSVIADITIRKPQCRVQTGENFTHKCYTAAVVLAPLLGAYSRNGISLGVLAMILFCIIAIVTSGQKVYLRTELAPLILYVIVDSCAAMLFFQMEDNAVQVFFRTAQYLMLLMLLAVGTKSLFMQEWAEKFYIRVAMFSSVYLIVQYAVAKVFKVYITGLFQNRFFPCNQNLYQMYFDVPKTGRRVPGLFTEPAEHCGYVVGALALLLFHPRIEPRKKYVLAGIISFGIVCSASSTGMILMGMIWAVYAFYRMRARRLTVRAAKVFLLLAAAAPLILVNMSSFRLFIERIIEGNSANVRLGGMVVLSELTGAQFLFGRGMQNTFEVFAAGYVRYISYFGIVGIAIWFLPVLWGARKLERRYMMLLAVFLVLNIGEATMLAIKMVLYMSFIFAAKSAKSNRTSEESINETK